MGHDHNHSHGTENVSDGVLLWTVIVNLGLSVFEFVAGAISGSVALMADALHNTNDAAALLIAYIARKISRKGADGQYTFGYRRAELIGAMIQLTALILVGLYLVYEAVRRFFDPIAKVSVSASALSSGVQSALYRSLLFEVSMNSKPAIRL